MTSILTKQKQNHYDIIIIGAGLSGLYSAYNIKKMSPQTSFLILESNKKQYIGGRIGNELFYNVPIVIGAGIGRKKTDKLLFHLLDELKIKYNEFTVDINYSPLQTNYTDVKKTFDKLREIYEKYKAKPSGTFKQYAIQHLGQELYKSFTISTGYLDYEQEDVYEVLYHYQMDNNYPGWKAIHLSWSTLVDKLCDKIGHQNIKCSSKVQSLSSPGQSLSSSGQSLSSSGQSLSSPLQIFEITTEQGKKYYANKVIVATRISTTQKLFPQYPIYKEIRGQTFLYVYAKFNKLSAEIMRQCVPVYTVVSGPLQKIIPMDLDKGVYMIAYCDNKNAELLKAYLENTHKNRAYFETELEKVLSLKKGTVCILAIKDYYWPIGTHYYSPLDKGKYKSREQFIELAQHPCPSILVVGEAVSRKQGWTEGALESVEKVLNKKWLAK